MCCPRARFLGISPTNVQEVTPLISDLMLPPYRSLQKPAGSTGPFLTCLLSAVLLVILLVPPIVASDNGPDTPAATASSQAISYPLADLSPSGPLGLTQASGGVSSCRVLAYNQPFQWSWLTGSPAGQRAVIVSADSDEFVLLCQQ